jgi:hypothetical protein
MVTIRVFLVVCLLAMSALAHTPTRPHAHTSTAAGSQPAEDAIIRQVSIDRSNVISYIKTDGIYTSGRAGRPQRVVALGDAAPRRAGGRFAEFLDLSSTIFDTGIPIIGSELRIVFKARITPSGPGEALFEGNSKHEYLQEKHSDFGFRISDFPAGVGIFLFSESRGVDAIALEGDTAPDTGGGEFSGFPGRVLISTLGTILFKATVQGSTVSEGLFFVPPAFLTGDADIGSVVVEGEAAPNTGRGRFRSFGEYHLIEAPVPISLFPLVRVDIFAYIANVQGGGVPQGLFSSTFAVVSGPFQPLRLELRTSALVLAGENAAGLRGTSAYAEFEDVVLTRKPEVVFRARLSGTGPTEGIFQRAFLGPIQLDSPRVLQGDNAPVFRADVTFARFGRLVANNEEQLFFEAELQGDGPSQGLFMVTLGPLTLMSETLTVGDRAPQTRSPGCQ